MTADSELITAIRSELAAAGDPERAAGQQRYMKSEMPFHGITAPQLRELLKPRLRSYAPADRTEWEDTIRSLWDEATHREQRYAATALARHRVARDWRDVESLPLMRHLVITGAWWDHVDEIAAHLVGGVLAAHRTGATPIVRTWAGDDDLWVRRTAILSQLRHKDQTDLTLLTEAIDANASDPSFWLRKAIGWALREQAKTDPQWVRKFVASRDLSPLSRREALKNLT